MIKDLVSILIPTYNRKKIVGDAVDCALGQTYGNIEIIVVDNYSLDGTYEFLKEKYESNSLVKIHRNKMNLGPVMNWVKCLEYAKGEFCKILWSDDLMEDTFLEKAVKVLKNEKEVAFVYSKVVKTQVGTIRKYGTMAYSLGQTGKYKKEIFIEKVCRTDASVPMSPGCALFRTDDVRIIDKVPNNMGIDFSMTGAGPDILIYLFSTLKYKYIYYIDEVLNYFRMHSESISCSGIDLYYSYMMAKFYFISQIAPDKKCKKILSENLIKHCISERKNLLETFRIVKMCNRMTSGAEFILLYLIQYMKII